MWAPRTFFASLFCANEKSIFTFGGFDGKEDLKTCERYRVDTNTWQKLPELPQARNGSCAIQFEEEKDIYIFGGRNLAQGSMNSILKFNTLKEDFIELNLIMEEPLHDFKIVILDQVKASRILLLGGRSGTQMNQNAYLMDLSLFRKPKHQLKRIPPIYSEIQQLSETEFIILEGH